jgi:hypothetical protein
LRRYLFALALPVLLAGCDQSPPAAPAPPPAATPAPAAPAPAAPPPAQSSTAIEPLIGSWAATPENCATPIVVAADRFEGAENSCTITGWTDNGDGTLTAATSCQSAGQTANERIRMEPLFGPQGEGIRLTYLDRGGDPVLVFACRAPRP